MPSSKNESPSPRASSQSSRADLDSPVSGGNAWVDVQPPDTPGSQGQGQQRRRTSSVWSGHSIHVSEYLTDFDTDTDTTHEPSRPATPAAAQNDPGPALNNQDNNDDDNNNMPQPPLSTPHDGDDDNNSNTQPRQPGPSWTWRTLLLLDNEQTEALELDCHSCAAITIHEEDTATFAALRAKVLGTLRRMVLHSSRSSAAATGLSWLDSQPKTDIYISWWNHPRAAPGVSRASRPGLGGGWGPTYMTRVSPLGGGGDDREGEEGRRELGDDVSWMRENMEAAASGLGDALLVVRLDWCGLGGEVDEGDGDYGEDACSVAPSGGMGCREDQGEEALEISMEASRAVCSSSGFLELGEY